MTTQLASARAAVEEIPPQTLDTLPDSGGLTDDRALPGNLHSEVVGWLTTVLRPAGSLDRAARRRLGKALDHLAASCDMVIIDLTATQVAARARSPGTCGLRPTSSSGRGDAFCWSARRLTCWPNWTAPPSR